MPLNQSHRSDYYFGGEDGKSRQFGRVQAGELLADLDSMEDELRRYYDNADENYQIIEGIISPVPIRLPTDKQLAALHSGKLKISQLHVPPKSMKLTGKAPHPSISIRGFPIYHEEGLYGYAVEPVMSHEGVIGVIKGEYRYRVTSALLFAWLRGLERNGIITYYTVNWVQTAQFLAAFYNNEQKPPGEHTTLQRYIRPRIVIKEHNPFVKALMSLSIVYQLGIGEDKATSIATVYNSILDIAMASVEELCDIGGIGRKTAEKLLRAVGRQDI